MNVANGTVTGLGYQPWLPFYDMEWIFGLTVVGMVGFIGFSWFDSEKEVFQILMLNLAPGLALMLNCVVWAAFPGLGANPTLALWLWVSGMVGWGVFLMAGTQSLIDKVNKKNAKMRKANSGATEARVNGS